jgi:hypothetical protein
LEVFPLTGESDHTEIELEIDKVRIRVSGTEEFVKAVFTDEKWEETILHLLDRLISLSTEKKGDRESDEGTEVSDTPWIQRLAKDVGVSPEFIENTFQQENEFVKVYDWPINDNIAERRREVALLIMYPNQLLHNINEFSKDNLTGVYDELGLKYDHNLRPQLTKHVGIDSPESKKCKINAQGRKAAKKLIKDQEARKAV